MERARLITDKENLSATMKGINGWIEENPDVTEPNMFQMIECLTNLGIIARGEGVAQMPGKFPEKGSELASVYGEWNRMYKSRLSFDKTQEANFSVNKDTNLYRYFTDLNMRCCTGEFRSPMDRIKSRSDEAISAEEKAKAEEETTEFNTLLCKIGSVGLYINQQKRENPKFLFDNQREFEEEIQARYLKYKDRDDCYIPREANSVIKDIMSDLELSINNQEKDEFSI